MQLNKQIVVSLALSCTLAIALFPGCGPGYEEMPITTKSAEARKLFIKARNLYENLREDEAREVFSQALEKDLDFALCHFYLADLATTAVEFQTHLKLAASLAHHTSEGEELLIESYRALAENKPEKAIQLAEELVKKYPRDKRAHRYLGYLYRDRDEDKAIAAYKQAIALDENYAAAYNNLGYAYRRKGDYEKAIEYFQKYLELLPDEANPYDSIADLYTKMGRHEEAIAYYEKAVSINAAFSFSQSKIGENFVFLSEFDKARQAFEKALDLATTPAEKASTLQKIYISYIYQENLPAAIRETERALAFARKAGLPEWQAQVLLDRATIFVEMGETARALQELHACKDLLVESNLAPPTQDNFIKNALYCETLAETKRNNLKGAGRVAERLRKKIELGDDPLQLDLYYTLKGFLYHLNGQHEFALDAFKRIKKIEPFALFWQGACFTEMGESEKARQVYEKAANWNEYSIGYALIRPKARKALAAFGVSEKSN